LQSFEKKFKTILHVFDSILKVELHLAVGAGKCKLTKIIRNSFVNQPGLKLFFATGTLVILVLILGIDATFAHINSTEVTTPRPPYAILANAADKLFFKRGKAIFRLEADG
jgi:hypothetical protein